MIKFQRILFPVDFSDQCRAVVPAVKAMAKIFDSELIVLHVVDLPMTQLGSPEAAAWSALINAEGLRMAGKAALERFLQREFSGMAVIPEVGEGDAAGHIIDCAESHHADLIMMPTHGYGLFRAFLMGSVTAKVLHDAGCPVWTGVHTEQIVAHSPDGWKRILCAVDTVRRDLSVLRWAAEFAAEQGLELRLVHAVRGADPTSQSSDPKMYEFLFNIAREEMAKMQAEAGTHLDVCLLGGRVGPVVRKAANGHDADAVIIGRGAMLHGALGRLRSSAYSIIREAPCPVISLA